MNAPSLVIALTLATAACSSDDDSVTLYRSSLASNAMRVHIATFDSSDGIAYNKENCELARTLYQAQPGVKTRFWCEKGSYRP